MLLALLAAVPGIARADDLPPLRPDTPPRFTADIAISLDSEGRPALSVAVSVPYSELQWIRLDDGYVAGAEFTVSFRPRGGGRIYGDAWQRRVRVADFGLTRSPNTSIVVRRSFDVPPDRYRVEVQVRSLQGGEPSVARGSLEVPDYSKVPVGFADLVLGTEDTTGTFLPVPTRRFGLNVSRLAARATLFDRRSGTWPRDYVFRYRLLDELGDELLHGEQTVHLTRSAEPVVVKPSNSNLFIGQYVFEVELIEGRSKWRVDRSFEVEESGPPRGKEFQRMLEPLSYIADPKEIEVLRSLPESQQAAGWDAFWKRRDPTPETRRNEAMIEFFRRVRYAEQHFQGYGPGWRSDMGRIYIKFGPPDQIETQAATATLPQLEIWYYNQPYRRFVFADREGFGRYVLTNPSAE